MRTRGIRHAFLVAAGIACAGAAPMQCPSDDRVPLPTEPDAAEECYDLAQGLRARGDLAGWRFALEFILERFPDSRFASRARMDLEDAGILPAPGGAIADEPLDTRE